MNEEYVLSSLSAIVVIPTKKKKIKFEINLSYMF